VGRSWSDQLKFRAPNHNHEQTRGEEHHQQPVFLGMTAAVNSIVGSGIVMQ